MDYNYILTTGDTGIASSIDFMETKNRLIPASDDIITESDDYITGYVAILLSANSQTLNEIPVTLETINGVDYYYSLSGDFSVYTGDDGEVIIKPDGVDFDLEDVLAFDTKSNRQKIQTVKTTGETWFGDTLPALTSSISPITTGEFFSGWDVFFNGQKVIQEGSEDLDDATGVIFAIEKDQNIIEITGENADVIGIKFIPEQVDLYVNGMTQLATIYLEGYSGISSIVETGVSSCVSITGNFNEQLSI